mmetsp:Transcript_5388/g.15776  ORF Transcript_5388/g.15776 Transcript_5388/m.15776 type:complete len:263 (-) Transcript_5388:609-1397(-)
MKTLPSWNPATLNPEAFVFNPRYCSRFPHAFSIRRIKISFGGNCGHGPHSFGPQSAGKESHLRSVDGETSIPAGWSVLSGRLKTLPLGDDSSLSLSFSSSLLIFAMSLLVFESACSPPFCAPNMIAETSSRLRKANIIASPVGNGSPSLTPKSYPSLRNVANVSSIDFGTFSKAAVPVAPTPGGKPYKVIAIFLSLFSFCFKACHFLIRLDNANTRSLTKKMSSPHKPPKDTASMAPSNSGNAYKIVDCSPPTPDSHQLAMS